MVFKRMGSLPEERLQIGSWLVDSSDGHMMRGAEIVRPDARAMSLLLYLASRPGEVIGINELLDRVWPDVTVSQDSVYQAIASLRRIFGDDPKSPAYIVTVPRQGYRLVAPVLRNEGRHSASAREPRRVPTLIGLALSAIALMLTGSSQLAIAPSPTLARVTSMNSVAVVPILDLTSTAMNDEYIADGLTEELIDRLSGIPHVRVPAPTASFYFKGKRVSVNEFARALHVAFVVDGSLRRSGDRLRVAVRFIRGSSGTVLWSETFDRPANDVLKIQDDVANQIAMRLKPCFLAHARQA